jgi:ferric-dicitrate binding protein FerR (iron transport regulator)
MELLSGPWTVEATRVLAADETFSLEPTRGGVEIACVGGLVWVTQAGDPSDHVLHAGERLRLGERGRIAAMALEPSRVRLGSAARRPMPEWARCSGAIFGTSSR